jgi:outer membrane lipoprotein-sorting protein
MSRALCLLFVVIGCTSKYTKPSTFDADPTAILGALDECSKGFTEISGRIETTLWREGERIRLEQLFLRSKSGNLRLDTLSPIGQPLSTVVYDGGRLLILDHLNNQFMIGAANREAMKRFLYVDLEPDALSTLLGGCVPFTKGKPSPTVSWDSETNRSMLTLTADHYVTQLWFENGDEVRRVDLTSKGKVYRLLMGDYESTGQQKRANRLKFEDMAQNLTIEFRISELRTFDQIPPSSFLLSPPPGAKVQPL